MDLNYLLSRHQISLMSADASGSVEARHAHLGLAEGYADRIRAYQEKPRRCVDRWQRSIMDTRSAIAYGLICCCIVIGNWLADLAPSPSISTL